MKDLITGGKFSEGQVSNQTKLDLKGVATVSDGVERQYGIAKYLDQKHHMIDLAVLNGAAVESYNHSFQESVQSFARSRDGGGAGTPSHIYDELLPSAAQSLLLTSRKLANPELAKEQAVRKAHVESKQAALEEAAMVELGRQAEHSAKAEMYFQIERWTTKADVEKGLLEVSSEGAKLEALKDQFRIRVLGFGWGEYHQAWSIDGNPFNVEDLKYALFVVMEDERGRTIPTSASVRRPRSGMLSVLGTLTPEALELRQESTFTAEQLRKKREEIEVTLEQKHQAKEREKRDSNALRQPDEPPALDATFVGKKIEILEEIQEELDNEEQDNMDVDRSERRSEPRLTYYKQWLPATVVMISTGLEKKQGKKGRSTKVPPGQFFISFDDGENRWIPIKKDEFNCLRVGSWRLDLDFPENRPEDNHGEEEAPEKSSDQEKEEVEESECGIESDEDYDDESESDD